MLGILIAFGIGIIGLLTLFYYQTGKKEKIVWIQVSKETSKSKTPLLNQLDKVGLRFEVFIAWWAIAITIGFIAMIALQNPAMIFIACIANYFSVKMYFFKKEREIREKAKEQLGPALQNLGAAYRITKSWVKSLETIIPTLQEPLKNEFERVYQLHTSNVLIGDAFNEMMIRMKVPEMKLFVTMAELSQTVGEGASEGVMVAGSYFQTKRLAMADLANAMLSAVKENRMLTYIFIGIVLFFRLFYEEFFVVYMNNLIGQLLLAIYIGIAICVPIVSYFIIKKEA
ncbi:hypothetical protein ABHN05_13165 [Brevibacillus laterosporus]|uniref:type II secretion system F family protein n=1 Tax=Brevibacillus laterosporus TaxID=1465 RepID=UPI0011280A69|nr:hypothetical protein [Brevibacillus laterosporus]MBG9790975.1 hypothetical protein [Brevibacillus laterosporus]MBG9804902.1 hypothetical protein [Brevibacillus laterosporus]MED1790549.1 hypothetical protein [Brevibacillus laterosporus]MED4762090.1 hypothetical protein [Brevibacillus laterosporus]TPH09951.1 hypothetical protein EGH09_21585 [Brevibacillus laterosporus]